MWKDNKEMIRIQDKKDCCGCSACVQICPKHCIGMRMDEEGFLYPFADVAICVGCGLCEKVCPIINNSEERIPIKTLAVRNLDEDVRFNSSSGGAFHALATIILQEGGIVFGARFNEKWEVIHDYIERKDDLYLFLGSKYVQSVLGNTFSQAESFLKDGKKVLFSGTSCQIAGLKRYLRKDYDNLMTVDVICHGVPSPLVWRDYLTSVVSDNKIEGVSALDDILSISFRSKVTGWKQYSFEIFSKNDERLSEIYHRNIFMQGFLHNLYLRPSCYYCHFKKGRCGSDISLGDYWGIEKAYPELDDNKGVGVVLVYNETVISMLYHLDCRYLDAVYDDVVKSNICIEQSVAEPEDRTSFWHDYEAEGVNAIRRIIKHRTPNIWTRTMSRLRQIFTVG